MARNDPMRWLVLTLGLAGLAFVVANWALLLSRGIFQPRTALFGPLSSILIFLGFQPEYIRMPRNHTPKTLRVVMMITVEAFAVGVANFLAMRALSR